MKTLMIAPHMDDEAISCGGLLARSAPDVFVLAVHGRFYPRSPRPQREENKEERRDFFASLKTLGVTGHAIMEPEGEPFGLGFYPLLRHVEFVLARDQPELVIIPSADDLNQDHRHLNHICEIALRPINLGNVRRVLEFHALDGRVRTPTYFVALRRSELDRKLGAINCYRRERRELPSPRAPENVEAQARVWGAACGHEFAEAYTVHLERD